MLKVTVRGLSTLWTNPPTNMMGISTTTVENVPEKTASMISRVADLETSLRSPPSSL